MNVEELLAAVRSGVENRAALEKAGKLSKRGRFGTLAPEDALCARVAQAGVDAALDEAQRQANAAGKAICVKCGRVFTTCQEYRINAQGRLICRRPCREVKHG